MSSELSDEALAALQEFYRERDDQEKRFEALKAAAAAPDSKSQTLLSMEIFTEDWNSSQFWVCR